MTEPLPSTPPSDEDSFYLTWGKETIKKNIENAHGVLAQFLTLNTALMGGSIVFLKEESIQKLWQMSSLTLFFIALFFAFLGVLPHESKVSSISPSEIRTHKEKALSKKRCLMWGCAIMTGGGLVIMAIGVVLHGR